jgi:hypothetical protein
MIREGQQDSAAQHYAAFLAERFSKKSVHFYQLQTITTLKMQVSLLTSDFRVFYEYELLSFCAV